MYESSLPGRLLAQMKPSARALFANDFRWAEACGAYADSKPVRLAGVDGKHIDVRVLAPADLAISKLSRFSEQDRKDIELLARRGLINARVLRKRTEEALGGCIGDMAAIRSTIDIACRVIDSIRLRRSR